MTRPPRPAVPKQLQSPGRPEGATPDQADPRAARRSFGVGSHPAQTGQHDAGSDVRSTDRDVLMSPSVRKVLEEQSIRILGWDDPQLLPNR